jgi:iron complex outermembrane receptor protein
MRQRLFLWISGSILCAAGAAASAEDLPELEAITVTAQKRTQDIQDVPIAISAFSEQALRARGITDLHGVSALVPNVNLDQGSVFSGSNSVLAASIRGIGQDDFAFNLDPGVGVYLDGVYFARTIGANQNLIDVDHIEILKGPQGTLFGRNTIGGAISIVTRTPGDQFFMQGEATTGSFNRRDLSLMVDVPLAEHLLSTFTVATEYRDGYQRRLPYPTTTPYVSDPVDAFKTSGDATFATPGGQNEQVIRAKVVWQPADSVTATFAGDWTHTNQPSTAISVLQTITTPTGQNPDFAAFYNACVLGIAFTPNAAAVCGPRATVGTGLWQANVNPNSNRLLYGPAVTQTGSIDSTYGTGPDFDRLDSYGTSATIDWMLDSSLKLRSITGLRRLNWSSSIDADGSPIVIWQLGFEEGQHQVSEELQLLGTFFDSRLNLVAGLYFFNEGGYINDLVTFGAGLIQIDGPNRLDTSSYATYLHADYQMTDRVGLTVGGRFSADRKSFTGGQQDLNQFFYQISGCQPYNAPATALGMPGLTCQQALGFPNPNNPNQIYPYGQNHLSFNEFNPTANLQYRLRDGVMAYLSYASGFKSGGWTTRLTEPLPLGSAAPSFGPETDKTYELGLKSEWLEHRLIVNAATFLSNYDQIQLTYDQLVSPTTQNAGNARIKGVEVEAQSLLGSHITLNGTFGYMDAKYTEVNRYAVESTGPYLPKTPRLKLSVSPEAHTTLSNGATVRLLTDYTHTAEIYNDVQDTWAIRRPKEDLVNLSAALVSPSGKVTLTVGAVNLTDRRYLTTGQQDFVRGVVYGTYDAPREWYATLGAKY